MYLRDYDGAIAQFRKNLVLEPNHVADHRGLGFAYVQKGMFAQAIAEFKQAQSLQDEKNPGALAILGYGYGMAGDRDQAQRIKRQLQQNPQPLSSNYKLLLNIGLGEKDQSFALLDKAAPQHELIWSFVAADPRNDSLRSDPRFAELFRRVQLPY